MDFANSTIGFALTGSHCTYADVLEQITHLRSYGAKVIPILSHTVAQVDSRFGKAIHWRSKIEELTDQPAWTTVAETEPIGPQRLLDCLVIAPCTGNTLARLAQALTDGPVLMAAKAQMRNHRPVVIALSTNDALGLNAINLAHLLVARDIYFVPMGQDDPLLKPKSLRSHPSLIPATCQQALQGKQLQPLLVSYPMLASHHTALAPRT